MKPPVATATAGVELSQHAAGLLPLIPGAEDTLLNAMPSDSLGSLNATSKQLRQLVHSFVSKIRVKQLDIFSAFGNWPNLTHVCLSRALPHDSHQACALLVTGKLPNLQALDVSFNNVYTLTAQQLASADWPSLTSLNFRSTNSGSDCPETCQHIASGKWPHLAALNYSLNRMTVECLSELVKGAWPLKLLDVSDNGEYFHGSMEVLVTAWTSLEELNLAGNRMIDKDCQHLGIASWPHLLTIKVSGDMPFRGIADLGTAKLPSLAQLDLSSQWLRERDVLCLSRANWPHLTHLVFGGTHLSDTVELASMAGYRSFWQKLKFVTITSGIDADDVFLLLGLIGQSLKTLHVVCEAGDEVLAQPQVDSWPQNTYLHLNIILNAHVLRSLHAGFWPTKSIQVICDSDMGDLKLALEELVKFDSSVLESFGIAGSQEDSVEDLTQICQAVVQANWPALKKISVKHTKLEASHVQLLVAADLPLLESMTVSSLGNSVCFGVSYRGKLGTNYAQLSTILAQGNWPFLKELHLPSSHFAGYMHPELQPVFARWSMLKVHHQCGVETHDYSVDIHYPKQ